MKAISAEMIMSSASTRVDGSLSLRFSTGELQPGEKTAFFELLNKNLKVIIQPSDEPAESLIQTAAPLDFKTPSQRLRGVMFVEWKQRNPDESFQEYYAKEMEKVIDRRKAQLEPAV